ncbi:hypothetical protein GCM10010507_43740 [Streptomyces cinnamoneus]|uniref:L,D-transpeptidase n=1 Tax=Streptomyces cinnamoneus TaxID=53446 RepID=A0A918TY36_STRCJ|nr:hypothetical protein GCM10010507_43740 [Streptomyces cinnamoneus]
MATLTAAALAGVGFLAVQAEAAPDHPKSAQATGQESGKAKGDGGSDKGAASDAQGQGQAANAVPEGSGTGLRVVYALGKKRVWLVGSDGKATRTYEVAPSTVSPPPGAYKVTSRDPQVTGSDGIPIEHVVRFHKDSAGIVFGFSAAVDGSSPKPDPAKKTGGIREQPADGRAMWEFAVNNTKVVVVP